jgi:succinate-semialdehyde dehydrogenase/glutarate-semialdehyde dehydrogenase
MPHVAARSLRRMIDVRDPATGQVIGSVPDGGAAEAIGALDRASAALPAWRALAPAQRAQVLRAAEALMRQSKERLAAIITAENGKPLEESRGEVDYSADYLASAADEAERLAVETVRARRADRRLRAIPGPIGVVGAITPWNFPLAMIARKTAPALAAGCTQVAKPSELTPLSAIAFAELLAEAGLPAGCVSIVTGDAAAISGAWFADGRMRKLSFTGSTDTGRILMHAAAQQIVRLSLELGGHAPFIVLADADIDVAVSAAMAGKFRVAGQTCVCPNRFIVHESVHDAFAQRFASAAAALAVGRGSDPATKVGPLINGEAVAKVERHIADAVAGGGSVLCGGGRVRVSGCLDRFIAPTVIAGVRHDCLAFREETFGPVAPIAKVGSIDEAVALANASPWGLAAYVMTRDSATLERVGAQLHCGIIGGNVGVISDAYAPFGGCGWSGFGREGGRWGVDEYVSWTYCCDAC